MFLWPLSLKKFDSFKTTLIADSPTQFEELYSWLQILKGMADNLYH